MQQTHILKITLAGIRPTISRTMRVPSSFTLADLHDVIQLAFGWEDCHLHEFQTDEGRYAAPHPEDTRECIDESTVTLDDVLPRSRARARYIYDFGDDWIHEIVVIQRVAEQPESGGQRGSRRGKGSAPVWCLEARRCCPPEDCGGPPGYQDLLDALTDPDHERHAELTSWVGGSYAPESVSLAEINKRLA